VLARVDVVAMSLLYTEYNVGRYRRTLNSRQGGVDQELAGRLRPPHSELCC
jgi:hypothetical protein